MGSKKGKSKGGKKGAEGGAPPKMTKKEKKLRKKYATLQVEDPKKEGSLLFAVNLRRDELETAAETLMEQIKLDREERIRFQLERDFINEIMLTYWRKYRCLLTEEERKVAETNRASQDGNENKTIKAIEGKHFRYDAQINCTAMDVRDELRSKKLKEMLEKTWQQISSDIEDQSNSLAKAAAEYRKQIGGTRESLDDLQSYIDEHRDKMEQYTKDLEEQMENSKKLFHLIRRMELQMTEERWGEFVWKLSRNFELQYEQMKNYYNDATHSNLTLVFTLQDWMNDCIENRNMYLAQSAEYVEMMEDAEEKMPSLAREYRLEKMKHDFIVRTKQGIRTTRKEIGITSSAVIHSKIEYRQLVTHYQKIISERDYMVANYKTLISEAITAYNTRFEMEREDAETCAEMAHYWESKRRLLGLLDNRAAYYKDLLDRRDQELEKQELRRMRINKQSEDLRNSLEARLARIGLKKQHTVSLPPRQRETQPSKRLDWGPASLVANRAYPIPATPPGKTLCPPPPFETEIKLCETDSIKGFLAWKKKKSGGGGGERSRKQGAGGSGGIMRGIPTSTTTATTVAQTKGNFC